MHSPLSRVILTLLGGYLIILVLMTVHDWIKTEYPSPPAPPSTARIQHPFHHEQAMKALQRFHALPQSQRDAVKKSLASNLIPMETWLNRIDQTDYQVLCMGELHREATRAFLADHFFTAFDADALMLETTPEKLEGLIRRMEDGRTYFPLLGADILNVLRAVKKRNPDVSISGIEETDEQQKAGRGRSGSRDISISENFRAAFRPGMRHVILFGALHCTDEPNWLYKRIHDRAPRSLKTRMLNACVLGEHQSGPLEGFIYFLDEIGLPKKNFVIPDAGALHPWIYTAFERLSRQILEKYRALVVFRM